MHTGEKGKQQEGLWGREQCSTVNTTLQNKSIASGKTVFIHTRIVRMQYNYPRTLLETSRN